MAKSIKMTAFWDMVPSLKYHPGILLDRLRKATKIPQSGQSIPRMRFVAGYEAGMLTLQLQCSVL
jgi:hypothetical protein